MDEFQQSFLSVLAESGMTKAEILRRTGFGASSLSPAYLRKHPLKLYKAWLILDFLGYELTIRKKPE